MVVNSDFYGCDCRIWKAFVEMLLRASPRSTPENSYRKSRKVEEFGSGEQVYGARDDVVAILC